MSSNLGLIPSSSFLNIHLLSLYIASTAIFPPFRCGDIFRSPLTHFHHLYPDMLYAHLRHVSVQGEAGGMWEWVAGGMPLGNIGGK